MALHAAQLRPRLYEVGDVARREPGVAFVSWGRWATNRRLGCGIMKNWSESLPDCRYLVQTETVGTYNAYAWCNSD